MFQKLVNHNDDLRKLVEKGYAVGFDSNYLIVRDVPYLNEKLEQRVGAIVAKLVFVDPDHVKLENHQILFAGGVPYGLNGEPVPNMGGGAHTLALSDAAKDVVVERSFSNKRKRGETMLEYDDFFDKTDSYVGLISGPAMARYGANPLTFRIQETIATDSVFKFHDTLTSRAEITDLAAKFKDDVIAIIGLGGTGAYLLDFLVKTPVREIRAYDGDTFHVHTAFRSPGRLDVSEFGKKKADVYRNRYENFRTGLSVHAKYIDRTCAKDLEGVTFAFVCVDKGAARAEIFNLLLALNIPFIDVGLGLHRREGRLTGMIRTNYFSQDDGARVRDMGLAELTDQADNLYRTSVQIAELNALNASFAIDRFKQIRGFYFEEAPYYHVLFDLSDLKTVATADFNENK